MYYDSNKISYHPPISSVSVQGNKPYSVQQFLLSISIFVSALVFVITNHSQTNGFVSFYSACHLVLFACHECSPLVALVPIHLPVNIHVQSLKQVTPQTHTLPSTRPGFMWQHIPTAVTIPYFCVL